MPACVFEEISAHVDRFSPDDRTDRPGARGRARRARHAARRGRGVGRAPGRVRGRARRARPAAGRRDRADPLALGPQLRLGRGRGARDRAPRHGRGARRAGRLRLVGRGPRRARPRRARDRVLRRDAAARAARPLGSRDRRSRPRRSPSAGRRPRRRAGACSHHVGGDHAADSCVVHVPGDDVLFLGDCLYQRLYAPEPLLTIAGVRALLAALAPFAVAAGRRGARRRRGRRRRLRRSPGRAAARRRTLVEAHGAGAAERAAHDEDLAELVAFLLVGEGLASRARRGPNLPATFSADFTGSLPMMRVWHVCDGSRRRSARRTG